MKKAKFVFHTKQGLHTLDTETSQLMDVYCEDRIDLKDTTPWNRVFIEKLVSSSTFQDNLAKYENRSFFFNVCTRARSLS
jgi:hypothetical protein